MIDIVETLLDIEQTRKVKCLHNEIKIIHVLLKSGPMSSLNIMRATNRSISAHNSDIKRLLALGAIVAVPHHGDGRVKLYDVNHAFFGIAQ